MNLRRPSLPSPSRSPSPKVVLWSIVIAVALLTSFAFELAVFGGNQDLRKTGAGAFPGLDRLAGILSLYVIALCAINVVSVVLQCGLGQCHTFGYVLLQ